MFITGIVVNPVLLIETALKRLFIKLLIDSCPYWIVNKAAVPINIKTAAEITTIFVCIEREFFLFLNGYKNNSYKTANPSPPKSIKAIVVISMV